MRASALGQCHPVCLSEQSISVGASLRGSGHVGFLQVTTVDRPECFLQIVTEGCRMREANQ